MRFLRSNTAVIITVGPFYDKTDGVTIETALTITNERITLTADTDAGSAPTNILDNITGATAATANDLNYITGNDAGMMQLELAAADVNRVGRMFLSITDAANHVPVFHELFVLPQAIYDWLTGVIVPLPSNMTQILGTAVSTPATAGILDVNTKNMNNVAATAITTIKAVQGLATDGVIPTATNVTTVNGLAANVITAASMAADASTEIRSLASGTSDSGTTTTMVDAARTEADTDYWKDQWILFTSGNLLGQARLITGFNAATDTITYAPATTQAAGTHTYEILPAAKISGVTLVDTLTTYTGNTLQTGDSFARLGAPAGASVSVDVAAVKTETASIQSDTNDIQTRLPASLTSGKMESNVGAITAGVIAAGSFAAGAFDAVWTVATRTLTAFDASFKTGYALSAAGVQAIWDALTSALTTASTIGKLLVDNINATISSRSSHSAADVWASATRTLTAATNITSTGGTTVPQTGDSFARIGAPAGASVSVDIAAVKTDTAAIKTKTDSLTFTTATQVDANIKGISDDSGAADRLEALMDGIIVAQINDAGATTTVFIADGFTEATNDHFNGRLITFISGALSGQQTSISDYVGATQTFTVVVLTEAPANNDFFVIH